MTHILYHFAVCYVWQDSSGVIHVSGLDIVAGGYILRFSIMIDLHNKVPDNIIKQLMQTAV